MCFKKPIVRPAELADLLGVSKATLWKWRKRGLLPEPMSLGPRFVGWSSEVLNAWLDSQNKI